MVCLTQAQGRNKNGYCDHQSHDWGSSEDLRPFSQAVVHDTPQPEDETLRQFKLLRFAEGAGVMHTVGNGESMV